MSELLISVSCLCDDMLCQSPILVCAVYSGRDHYLSFFHSLHTNQYCHPTFENYYFGAIIFSSAPASMSGPPGHSRTGDSTGEHASTASFTVTAVSKVPFYHSGWYEGKWLTRKKGWAVGIEYVFFPMNFYFVDTHTGDVLQVLAIDLRSYSFSTCAHCTNNITRFFKTCTYLYFLALRRYIHTAAVTRNASLATT